jgi:hypothetical protein
MCKKEAHLGHSCEEFVEEAKQLKKVHFDEDKHELGFFAALLTQEADDASSAEVVMADAVWRCPSAKWPLSS